MTHSSTIIATKSNNVIIKLKTLIVRSLALGIRRERRLPIPRIGTLRINAMSNPANTGVSNSAHTCKKSEI